MGELFETTMAETPETEISDALRAFLPAVPDLPMLAQAAPAQGPAKKPSRPSLDTSEKVTEAKDQPKSFDPREIPSPTRNRARQQKRTLEETTPRDSDNFASETKTDAAAKAIVPEEVPLWPSWEEVEKKAEEASEEISGSRLTKYKDFKSPLRNEAVCRMLQHSATPSKRSTTQVSAQPFSSSSEDVAGRKAAACEAWGV